MQIRLVYQETDETIGERQPLQSFVVMLYNKHILGAASGSARSVVRPYFSVSGFQEGPVSIAEDKDADSLEESLKGYKGKIMPMNKGTLTWDKDLIFLGRTQRGYEIDFDAQAQWGCIPTESLLMSVAGCLAIDVVSFLQKMKAVITQFRIDISGERNPTPPQYYKTIEMVIHISGEQITPKKMDRVISLSQDKYCSVYHSLRKDLRVNVTYVINEGRG
jgi:putative redox protein